MLIFRQIIRSITYNALNNIILILYSNHLCVNPVYVSVTKVTVGVIGRLNNRFNNRLKILIIDVPGIYASKPCLINKYPIYGDRTFKTYKCGTGTVVQIQVRQVLSVDVEPYSFCLGKGIVASSWPLILLNLAINLSFTVLSLFLHLQDRILRTALRNLLVRKA